MMKNYSFNTKMLLKLIFGCILLLSFFNGNAQTLNFTIDTATDNGTSITETLTDGPDTYVLTVDIPGSGAETLDDLGGNDLIFYFGSGGANNTFFITLTKNGNPVSFTLNGMDYDTLEDGFIAIVNQDNDEISANQEYLVGGGAVNITNTANAMNITEFKILQPDISDNADFGFHNINVSIGETLNLETFALLESDTVVYPNPSNGIINIKNPNVELSTIKIIDINGRTVLIQDFNRITIDVTLDLSKKLTSGLYFVTISSENVSTVRKLIIK